MPTFTRFTTTKLCRVLAYGRRFITQILMSSPTSFSFFTANLDELAKAASVSCFLLLLEWRMINIGLSEMAWQIATSKF